MDSCLFLLKRKQSRLGFELSLFVASIFYGDKRYANNATLYTVAVLPTSVKLVTAFPPLINLVTDNKEAVTRIHSVGERKCYARTLDF